MSDIIELNTTLPHTDDIGVAINEYILTHTINRNIKKLLENDIQISRLYKDVLGSINIFEYKKGDVYDFGQIIWFLDKNKKLWLLQSIFNDNSKNPQIPIDEGAKQETFEKYGWKNINETVSIEQLGVYDQLNRYIIEKINIHQDNEEFHKYGSLKNFSDINKKILKRDISNADENRNKILYPFVSGHFVDKTILDGTYRLWDCGLIEFNIIYRFGYKETDQDGYDIIECNNKQFSPSTSQNENSDQYNNNLDYFNNLDDMKIFMNLTEDETYESIIGNLKQKNRNNYVNTYFADLNLFNIPMQIGSNKINGFIDRNYMIFQTNNMTVDPDHRNCSIVQSKNQITFCNKTKKSITAILVTYPDSESSTKFGKYGGIASNSFGCKIIGRWK